MEKTKQKELAGGVLIYAIGTFGTKFLSFLIVPLYTYYISTTDMGIYDLLMSTVSLLSPLITLQISDAAYKWLLQEDHIEEHIRSTLQVLTINCSLAFALVFLINQYMPIPYCTYFAFILIMTRMLETLQKLLRGLKRQKLFAISGIVYSIVFLSLNLFQIVYLKKGVVGLFNSAIAANLVTLIFIFLAEKNLRVNLFKAFDFKMIKEMLKFSIPLIPNYMNWWIINSSNKYFVNIMYNEYIYEKKLNEEKLKEIENEKQIKFRKIHIKKREKLSKQYYQKIERFMIGVINELESKSKQKSHFNRPKIKDNNKTNILDKKKVNINKRIFSYNSAKNKKLKILKVPFSPLKNIDNNTVTYFELPKMRFSPKNDLERIREDIYKRDGKIIDEKFIWKLNKKYRKNINDHIYDFLKINQNNQNSINNIYPLNISENMILKNLDDSSKRNESEKKYKIFKNRILNSKLIQNITCNEKYNYKTFYQGLAFSLITHKNTNNMNKTKFNKIKPISSPIKTNTEILKKKIQKEKNEISRINSINFYQNDMKKFHKYNKKYNNELRKGTIFEDSSDSSINDNGQEEIFKKIISLNYPILNETIEEKKTENKNNLLYLKNLFEEDQKEEEHQKKVFVHNNKDYFNYYAEKKRNEIDKRKKYFF